MVAVFVRQFQGETVFSVLILCHFIIRICGVVVIEAPAQIIGNFLIFFQLPPARIERESRSHRRPKIISFFCILFEPTEEFITFPRGLQGFGRLLAFLDLLSGGGRLSRFIIQIKTDFISLSLAADKEAE